ncbi:MAG: hypothetical protein LBI29_03770 [Rickettsiales bacterium]|jgi:hypothetical protein|nr:hypothetical protein [Rickettsiales bacterium]
MPTAGSEVWFGNGLGLLNWASMLLVMGVTLNNNLIQTRGLFNFYREYGARWRVFLFFAPIFVVCLLFSWFRPSSGPSLERIFGGNHFEVHNQLILLLPVLICLALRFHIPLSLTFLVQSMFSRKNMIPEMLPGAAINYFLSLGISLIFWSLLRSECEKNLFGRLTDDFWFVVFQIFTGILWYNLLGAFMPNFVAFFPRIPNGLDVVLFLLSGLIIFFITIQNSLTTLEKRPGVCARAETKLSTLFNALYVGTMLVIANLGDSVPLITPWVSIGLKSGMKVAFGGYGIKSKIKVFIKRVAGDLYIISLGTVVVFLFVNIIKI